MRSVLCLSFLFFLLVLTCVFSTERPTSAKLDRPPDRPDVGPQCTPPPASMVAWWPGDGNANDIRGGNNGTLVGGATFGTGEVGQAFSFNGANAVVQVADNAAWDFGVNDFTIDTWVNFNAFNGADVLLAHDAGGGAGNNKWIFWLDGPNLELHLNGSVGAHYINVPWAPATGQWYHVALTRSGGSTYKFYVDGSQLGADQIDPTTIPNAAALLTIGKAEAIPSLNGLLDEVEIFNRALSAPEIAAIYNAGSAGKCKACAPPPNNLVSWWRAEGNAFDMRGGNNGTLQGGATFAGGEVGQAFGLNGTTQSVNVPDSPSLEPTKFTIDAWSNLSASPGTFTAMVAKPVSSGGDSYAIYFQNGMLNGDVCDSGGCDVVTSNFTPSLNTWYHYAFTFDGAGSTGILYVNGAVVGSGTINRSAAYDNNSFFIGRTVRNINNGFFPGLIDEVELFNRALTATEIQSIYNAGSNGKCLTCTLAPRGLVSWWPADGDAFDVRSSNNGTLENGTSFVPGEVGQAFSLDGGTQDVLIGNPSNLRLQDFTIDAWVQRASTSQASLSVNGGLIFSYGTGGYGYGLTDDGRIFLSNIGVNGVTTSVLKVTDTSFHHVAVAKSGTSVTFFLDGVAESVTYSTTFSFNTNAYIGQTGTNTFYGLVDELEIFNRALSQPEIQAMYDAGSAGKCKPTCLVAPPNLVGWWGGDGDARDISGNNNNGTLQNGAGFRVGKVGQAFSLDGTSQKVLIGNPADLQLQDFTIDAWIKRDDASVVSNNPAPGGIAAFYSYDTNGYGFGIRPVGTIFLTKVGVSDVESASVKVTDTSFHHVAVTKSGSTVTFYVDAVAETVGAYDPGFTFTSNAFIGMFGGGSGNFFGSLDEVEIFNRALSATEIQQIYNAGLAGKCKSASSTNPVQVGDATITFTGTVAYDATEIPIDPSWAGTLPAGDVNTGLAYDIQTDTYSSSYDICFNLQAITDLTVSRQLRVLHGESGILLDRTTSYNPSTHMLCSHVTSLSPFVIAQNTNVPTAAGASISGLVTTGDGQPLAGVVIRLSGMVNETTVTDSGGHYEFDDVGANQFYAVTPQLANFTFSPSNRSFSLLGNRADAIFTGVPNPIATANPLDTGEYFVREQYLDFLGREPDQEGLDYWSAALNQCNGDAACLSAQRIAVSAAFFASAEFQQSGSFVYRVYKAGLGRQLSYAEFTSDHAQVLGGAGLEANQAAFTNSLVQRTEFVSKYAANTTAETFVDALLQNIVGTGADLSKERDTLIALYLGAQASLPASSALGLIQARSAVLQAVAKNADYQSATLNPSFVLMEYFGYLRRDADGAGYQFWLNVLNSAPGNYRGMVCSFVTSAEYQRRFAAVVTRTNQDCGR